MFCKNCFSDNVTLCGRDWQKEAIRKRRGKGEEKMTGWEERVGADEASCQRFILRDHLAWRDNDRQAHGGRASPPHVTWLTSLRTLKYTWPCFPGGHQLNHFSKPPALSYSPPSIPPPTPYFPFHPSIMSSPFTFIHPIHLPLLSFLASLLT